MKRILLPIGVTALALMTGVGYSVAQPSDNGRTSRTTDNTTLVRTASSTTTGRAPNDVPGPCDEPEHANDAACTPTTVAPTTSVPTPTTEPRIANDDRAQVEDVRGPCDEAAHADDPRCTGTTVIRDDADRDRERADDKNDDRRRHTGDDAR